MENSEMASQAGSSGSNSPRGALGPLCMNWAYIPADVLGVILTMLETLTDYCHFGAVCRPWYRAAQADRLNRRRTVRNNQMPLLAMPRLEELQVARYRANARNNIQNDTLADTDKYRKACGSSHGWLITIDRECTWFTLLNPYSHMHIDLPELRKDAINVEDVENNDGDVDDEFFILKAVLSADPHFHPDDFSMMIIYGGMFRLALYLSRTKSWTFIDHRFQDFDDVVFYQGKFYLVDAAAFVYSCDIDNPVVRRVAGQPPQQLEVDCRKYLVESPEGDLLQVWRLLTDDAVTIVKPMVTTRFYIFKMLNQNGQPESGWEVVQSLEGVILFLGDNHGISVKSADCPQYSDDSIYFTMEFSDMYKTWWRFASIQVDIGRYSVRDNRVYRRYIYPWECNEEEASPPIWLIPTLRPNGLDL